MKKDLTMYNVEERMVYEVGIAWAMALPRNGFSEQQ